MPRRAKAKGVYQRGAYWLDWDRKADGSLRSPFLAIFWYDAERGRLRSATTRSNDVATARAALDRHYLENTEGAAICPTCGQRRHIAQGFPVLRAITDYLASRANLPSIGAVRPRLNHVVRYVAQLGTPELPCEKVDEAWIARFRIWLGSQPVTLTSGAEREKPRSLSSIENSVLQLAAAINAAEKRGDAQRPAQFKPIPTTQLNRSPQHRLSIEDFAAAFQYCFEKTHRKNERVDLRRFLMASISTGGRPDAVHEISTDPKRRQWNTDRGVLALNYEGRRQTRKYRATVRVPWQFKLRLEAAPVGFFIASSSVRSAWETMRKELGWPDDGEAGMKIVRRSIAQLLRDAGTPRAWSDVWRDSARKVDGEEIEMLLGHRPLGSVTDIYAAFDPDYLAGALAAIEAIIDEIEARVPGAFHRSDTGEESNIVPLVAAKRAANSLS